MRRLSDIDLRQIMIFRSIVECQSLAGAELVLNLSQSRVSAALGELETRLGARLCRRGRSGFALTEAGETLYEASHALVDAIERFTNQAAEVSDNLRRILRFGTVDAVATNSRLPLPEAFGRLRKTLPAVTIKFLTAAPEALEKQLITGQLDMLYMPCSNQRADLRYAPVVTERQSLYCGRMNSLFSCPDSDITSTRLASEPFVARGYLHHFDLKRIGHRGEEATVEMMESQLILILSGAFIGYLPTHYAQAHIERGALRCIDDARYGYDSMFYLVTQRTGSESVPMRSFRAIVEALATNTPPQSG